jgi:hypothetical protein
MDALAQDIYDYITAVVPDTNGDLATYVGALGDVLRGPTASVAGRSSSTSTGSPTRVCRGSRSLSVWISPMGSRQ